MTLQGGAVLFTDEVLKDEENIRNLIFKILEDRDTRIGYVTASAGNKRFQSTSIFKIIFNKKFDINFKIFSNSLYNIKAPRALIIKLIIGYPHNQVENEINIHKTLGAQTNMLPICPSFLFYEQINNIAMTDIGSAFYNLLQSKLYRVHYETFLKEIRIEDPKTSTQLQEMFIMEFIDCPNYIDFCTATFKDNASKQFTEESFYKYITLDTDIILSSPIQESEELQISEELQNFYTYYMASLLAIKGYHHSDLHSENIMICSDTMGSEQHVNQLNIGRTNIFPFVIDFGRAGMITRDELVFKTLITPYGKIYVTDHEYINPIYVEAQKNRANIVDYVTRLLKEENYVDAVLVISMCINPNCGSYPSHFQCYFDAGLDPIYMELYLINYERKIKYNKMLITLINERKELERKELERKELGRPLFSTQSIPIKINEANVPRYRGVPSLAFPPSQNIVSGIIEVVDGGKLVLKRQKSLSQKKSKTKKSKTKKTKKSNTKKSKTKKYKK